jgi:hypothetical protein
LTNIFASTRKGYAGGCPAASQQPFRSKLAPASREISNEQSGILRKFPDIDLANCTAGIFGKVAQLDAALKPGDPVEIYRSITADPATVPLRVIAGEDDED